MLCVPTLSVEAENVAPPFAFIDEEPIVVVPSRNVTIPAGSVAVYEVTLAEKVIG
jgi:hypothetical protein